MRFKTTYKIAMVKFIYLFLVVVVLFSCKQTNKSKGEDSKTTNVQNDLVRIKEAGVLRAIVDYNSTNYFVYRGKPMGFKYDILQELSRDLGVELEIVVSNNLSETFEGLKEGRYDLVAKNLTVTKERSNEIDFTEPIYQTRQVLVQRAKQEGAEETEYINSTLELTDKKIYVQKNTSYYNRLVNLSDEIGSNIEIVEDSVYGEEQLVALVAEGKIDYTVCDENVAKLNKTYYPNLDVSLKISFGQNIAWAVRKGSVEWKEYMDEWITSFKSTNLYDLLYHKYFESARIAKRMDSDFHSISGGKISQYDKMIQELAKEHNWDWRLIASIIYHESRFKADAGSWVGAYGLMQLMPSTAKRLGVENYKDPRQNIKAGILFLNWLNKQFMESIPDSAERMKFVLGSYNIGMGHVQDAQRLAEKYGKDRFVWDDNVAFFLRNKSAEKYYKDPVVRYGYCRGEEAFNYVNRVTGNYDHYLNVIDE
jgi:membrane-bound lytic murein transglycosylase F